MTSIRSIVTALALTCVTCSLPAQAQDAKETAPTPGTARFVGLENLGGFSGFFNLGQGTVRLAAILSPTCDECAAVFHEICRVMESTPTKRLRSYVVFEPVLEGDTEASALALAASMHDVRAAYFWDPNLAVANAFRSLSADGRPMMSGCFVFDTHAVLRESADPPVLQMDPHADDEVHHFDGKRLAETTRELLERFEAQQRLRPPTARE